MSWRIRFDLGSGNYRNSHPAEATAPYPTAIPYDPAGSERRRPRALFAREVLALDQAADSVLHVLVGRDLSTGGIRVEPHPGLAVGDLLRLAIYDASAKEPFIVRARIERDDAGAGLGLQFVDIEPEALAQLEAAIDSLPAVEALRPAEADPQGVLVAQILDPGESGRS